MDEKEAQELINRVESLPKGTMGIATALLGRYREFDECTANVWIPSGSIKRFNKGVDVGFAMNEMCRCMLLEPTHEWVWMLGDDHTFPPDLWLRLYERNVDIVVPMCLHKANHEPVINYGKAEGYGHVANAWKLFEGKSGLFDIDGRTCGNAGMLIRRHVLENMEFPWFRQGQLDPQYSSSDLFFSKYAQESGFKVYIDLDNPIGHLDHMGIWPRRGEDGQWWIDYKPGDSV